MPTAARLLRLAQDVTTYEVQVSHDTELLRRYLAERDEDAFAELVRRNGPFVLRACVHVLGESGADDAFQATFLLLIRSARRLTRSGSLAGWLHAAAVRIAHDARRADLRRRKREALRTPLAPAALPDDITWREVRERIDIELAALPESYRDPLVLCYVQELTYEEAAHRLGCAVGALRGRLERGKEKLRKRLARYGLPLAAPILVLGRPPAVSAALVRATLDSACTCRSSAGAAGGLFVSARLKAVLLASASAVGIAFAASDPLTSDARPNQTQATLAATSNAPVSPPRTDPLGESLPPGAVMRLGTRRFQVQTWPLKPILLPGGKHYLTLHTDHSRSDRNEFQWMDTGSGVVTDRWAVPTGQHAAGVSADGRWAVIAETKFFHTGFRAEPDPKTGPVRFGLYDLTACGLVKSFEFQSDEIEGSMAQVHGACISADGKWIATVNSGHGQTGRIRLWEVATEKMVWASEFTDLNGHSYTPISFTPKSSDLVLRASKGNAIHVVATGTSKVRSFPTMPEQVQGEVLAPDGSVVVLGTYSPSIRVWDLKTGTERASLEGHKEWARRFAFTPDTKSLVTAGNDPCLLVRDWPSGKVQKQIDLGRGSVQELLVSDDGRFADVLFWWETSLTRYDLATGKRVERPADTHRAEVLAVTTAADGSVLSLGRDNVLRRWDSDTGRQTGQSPLDPGNAPGRIVISPNGKVSGPHSISPDGRFRAEAGSDAKTATVSDTTTGKTVTTISANPCGWWSGPIRAEFSPDGRLLATTDDGVVRFWGTGNWQPRGSVPEGTSGLSFSPDGRMLVTTDLNDVIVWEVRTRSVRFKHRTGVQLPTSARFSPDGRFLAWAMPSGAVEVWEMARGRVVATFKGHDEGLRDFVFTPDSTRIITASNDCTLLVWDVAGATARMANPPPAGEKRIRASWNELTSADAGTAFTAVRTLASAPEILVAVARDGIRPAAPLEKAAVERLLADLSSVDFEKREQATKQLKAFGDQVEKPVAAFRISTESPEASRRADEVLKAVRAAVPSSDRLRVLRAVEALERAGTPATQELLRELAKGEPDTELTREAAASLWRLAGRN